MRKLTSSENPKFLLIIQKYNKIIVLLGLVLFAYFVPMGYNTVKILGTDLRVENINDDQEVTSFSSLKNNILVVVDGDKNIVSQEFKSWLELELFHFRSNSIVQATLSDDGRSKHIVGLN